MQLRQLQEQVADFNSARAWTQLHTSRDLVLAMTAELGELAELTAWEGFEKAPSAERIGQELSDIVIYVACLANLNKIDLAKAITEKIYDNGQRYPVPPE